MAIVSNNKYLQTLLENLVTSHETEINYTPIEVEIDKQRINNEDLRTIQMFLTEPRKRFFIFKIKGDNPATSFLELIARRSILNQSAEIILKSTSTEPPINPLKHTLNNPTARVRAGIQIQKSFLLPKKIKVIEDKKHNLKNTYIAEDLVLIPSNLPDFPQLAKQLKTIGIQFIQDSAAVKIREHAHAFTDGIISTNLPKGFYINKDKSALCYTEIPNRLPSALAPNLDPEAQIPLPKPEEVQTLFPSSFDKTIIDQLLHSHDLAILKNALITSLTTLTKDFSSLFQTLQAHQHDFIVPMLAKHFILGGEDHINLLTRLLKNCINKKINIDFLKHPSTQDAFLNPRGMKNLQKLLNLPAEQREWWNTLATLHLKNPQHIFDFNSFFEAYTQVFIPRMSDKNLTLPNPCPIQHEGHILITLNRVLEVIDNAENPQEQCLTLNELNWGPTGAHYAMTQAPDRFKQVASCMNLVNPEDTLTTPEEVYLQLQNPDTNLKPWIYRLIGQFWKKEVRLSDIQSQINLIQKAHNFNVVQKNQLTFILACTFTDKSQLAPDQWTASLTKCITILQTLSDEERSDLLSSLSRCYLFKPIPSLAQITVLIEQSLALKAAFPDKSFKDDLVIPLFSCFENDGIDVFNSLQERIQKTTPDSNDIKFCLNAIHAFTFQTHKNRKQLNGDLIKILAKINEPELPQSVIDNLLVSIQALKEKSSESFCNIVLSTLSQLNISKTQKLPKADQITHVIQTISNSVPIIPAEFNTAEKQEHWMKDYILEKNLLPGCVLGSGDISKLDDLIVDALVDTVKKRKPVLNIPLLKANLKYNLNSKFMPEQLNKQLDEDLMPLFDAVDELIKLLQTPNPKFSVLIDKLVFFETKKPKLINGVYNLPIIGSTKGEYIMSFVLTGHKHKDDKLTGSILSSFLVKFHNLIVEQINDFFKDEKNKHIVDDLNPQIILSWLKAFNDTQSLTFLFKEELVQKKVLPALKKTLLQLNTQDQVFENSILASGSEIEEHIPSDAALQNYKSKVESIASYLNLLIDIKDKAPAQFNSLYRQLQTGPLARLNYVQKQTLINKLLGAQPQSLDQFLKLTTLALEENPEADSNAIDRAINGLVALFDISDLEPETLNMFFKMSMAHNLRSSSPFPLADLNILKQSSLPEETKSLILKQIIQILSHMTSSDSPDLIKGLVQQTQLFLTQHADQAALCISLLKRVSFEHLGRDLGAYPSILNQLLQLKPEQKLSLHNILSCLAGNKKDDTVNLPILLDITKGLGRRSEEDIGQVLKLFATPPYPIAQSLNSALLAHGSEKLQSYCLNFDTNPFTKNGESRALSKQFETDRIKVALSSLKDLMHEEELPHSLQLQLARQLTYIETLGYTDPLHPDDFKQLKKLTACSRQDLKNKAQVLLDKLRTNTVSVRNLETTQLELLAYLREIYFRATGLFPNTTQMLMLLLSLNSPTKNLLMSIKTGEGKSLITPMLAVLQWAQGGTVDVCTANRTLLGRDYENNCEPFFKFLGIPSSLIQSSSLAKEYKLNGINCSTLEDMSLFRLSIKESRQTAYIQNEDPIHVILDECDDGLLDQTTLYKLVAETASSENRDNNQAQWVYPLAYQFINLPAYRNTDPAKGKVWDEEEDLEQFRLYINKQIIEQFHGDADKQNFMMATSNTELKQWINASCKAAKLIENKDYILQTIKEKNDITNESRKRMVCVPLARSTPKTGCIFTTGVQQALQARLMAERNDIAHMFSIDSDPPVLASQSARGLMKFYQETKGRLVGISGTPGDPIELRYLSTLFGTQAIGVDPYAGDKRKKHPPIFTFTPDATIQAIKDTINKVKKPITKPTMELNPDSSTQTIEEREAFILQRKDAIEQWSQTQTQPILVISEDFEDAQSLGQQFEEYRKAGFKVQVVTGKESPEKLERIIKYAGRANTITIGTAMLARGIDINPGNHPQGLFVIQTYTDSERMTTQIGGRAARNGKPGQWQPIYQVSPPQAALNKFLYYVLPFYRQQQNMQSIQKMQTQIKLQATIDRLYTQAVDQAQQTLMDQIHAWENFILEIYPADPKIKHDLYQWRETLLSELTHAQETSISQDTLEESITKFRHSISKLWENAKEEKWASLVHLGTHLTQDQNLRLSYLMQLDIVSELKVQTKLQPPSTHIEAATRALTHQNIESLILDKAGAVLNYTKPDEAYKKELGLAQAKQILPLLISELCTIYPAAIKHFRVNTIQSEPHDLPSFLTTIAKNIINQRNELMSIHGDNHALIHGIKHHYQTELKTADAQTIEKQLEKIKPLLLEFHNNSSKASLANEFKMQGIVLNFNKLYENTNLPKDDILAQLKASYDEAVMKRIAYYLLNELNWINKEPAPLHVRLERSIAKKAAQELHALATEVITKPSDKTTIQNLYKSLHTHQVSLQNVYMLSVGHTSPRTVIKTAINAIDSSNAAPYCDSKFKIACHDEALTTYHIQKFKVLLESNSALIKYKNDPVWNHLKGNLERIMAQNKQNQNHVIHELNAAIDRYSNYPSYQPYKAQLNVFKAQLSQSATALTNPNGLKQNYQTTLFATKANEIATLLHLESNKVRIQSGSDGVKTYIELQIESNTAKEGFTGFQSSNAANLRGEQDRVNGYKLSLAVNKIALEQLTNPGICDSLPPRFQEQFKKLFRLKAILDRDWGQRFDTSGIEELPKVTQSRIEDIQYLKEHDWTQEPVDLPKLELILRKKPVVEFTDTLKRQDSLHNELNQLHEKKSKLTAEIGKQREYLLSEQKKAKSNIDEQNDPKSSISKIFQLKFSNYNTYSGIASLEALITKEENEIKHLTALEEMCRKKLTPINYTIDLQRATYISSLIDQTKHHLAQHLHEESKDLIYKIEQELRATDSTFQKLLQIESNKSRYQTRRFFSSNDLLKYQASLAKEEGMIPAKAVETKAQGILMSTLNTILMR